VMASLVFCSFATEWSVKENQQSTFCSDTVGVLAYSFDDSKGCLSEATANPKCVWSDGTVWEQTMTDPEGWLSVVECTCFPESSSLRDAAVYEGRSTYYSVRIYEPVPDDSIFESEAHKTCCLDGWAQGTNCKLGCWGCTCSDGGSQCGCWYLDNVDEADYYWWTEPFDDPIFESEMQKTCCLDGWARGTDCQHGCWGCECSDGGHQCGCIHLDNVDQADYYLEPESFGFEDGPDQLPWTVALSGKDLLILLLVLINMVSIVAVCCVYARTKGPGHGTTKYKVVSMVGDSEMDTE